MPTTYSECPKDIEAASRTLMRRLHPKLIEADVTVRYLFAANDDGPALTHHAWPAAALVRINNLRDRVAGLADVTLLIDERWWKDASDAQRTALLDHELTHLEVKTNKVGAISYDDANRPRIKLRPHDFQLGGFHEIAKRYGEHAPEVECVATVLAMWKQLEFNFAA